MANKRNALYGIWFDFKQEIKTLKKSIIANIYNAELGNSGKNKLTISKNSEKAEPQLAFVKLRSDL